VYDTEKTASGSRSSGSSTVLTSPASSRNPHDLPWGAFPEQYRPFNEHVLVIGHAQGQMSGGEPYAANTYWLFRLRDGKVVNWTTYTDRDEALKAVGLEEL
jgi:hypothetical protein